MVLRILPFGTLPAVLHWGSCYITGMLYKGYTTVALCGSIRLHQLGQPGLFSAPKLAGLFREPGLPI